MLRKNKLLKYIILLVMLCIAACDWAQPPETVLSNYSTNVVGGVIVDVVTGYTTLTDKKALNDYLNSVHFFPEAVPGVDQFPSYWTFDSFSNHRYTKWSAALSHTYRFKPSTEHDFLLQIDVSYKQCRGKQVYYIGLWRDQVLQIDLRGRFASLEKEAFVENLRFTPEVGSYTYDRENVFYLYHVGRLRGMDIEFEHALIQIRFEDGKNAEPEDLHYFDNHPDDLFSRLTSLSDEEFHSALDELYQIVSTPRPAVRDSLNIEAEIMEQLPHKAGDTVFRIFRGDYMAGFAEEKTILQLTKQPYTQKELYAVANASGITLWELGRDGTLQQTDAYSGREQTYYEAFRDREELVKTRGYHIKPTLAFCLDSTRPQDGAMVYFSTDILEDYIYYKDLETGTAYDLFDASYMSRAKRVTDYRAEHGDADPQGAFHHLVNIQKIYRAPAKQSELGYGIVLAFAVTLYCALVEWYLRRRKDTQTTYLIGLPEEPTDRKRVYLIPGVIEDTPGIY